MKENRTGEQMTTNYIFGVVYTYPSHVKLKAMFIESDFTSAKLWFQGYISGTKEPHKWVLYKLGEIDENLKLKGFKIFVCTGMAVYKNTPEVNKYEQYKLFKEKKEEEEKKKKDAETLKQMFKENISFDEIVRETFGGKIV